MKLFANGGPNPRKVAIMLLEIDIPFELKVVDMYAGEHLAPDFLSINPNGRLPALIDDNHPDGPITLWESGAILQYLAEKTGRFLPQSGRERWNVIKWLHAQVTLAPYLGQAHLYRVMYREPIKFDIKRFTIEATRIYSLLDQQLSSEAFVAGENYSIADIGWYPWIQYHEWQGQDLAEYPNITRWYECLSKREAVRRGTAMPWPFTECGPTERGRKVLEIVKSRLSDPRFALKAAPGDAALANIVI